MMTTTILFTVKMLRMNLRRRGHRIDINYKTPAIEVCLRYKLSRIFVKKYNANEPSYLVEAQDIIKDIISFNRRSV